MRRAALCLVLVLGCKRTQDIRKAPEPPKPQPFSAEVEGARRTFPFGHAFVTARTVNVHLTTTRAECPSQFPTNAYTAWFAIPAGHDAKFFAGTPIDVDVRVRQALEEPSVHRGASVRVESIADGHARGHLELAIGRGDFDVTLCDPSDLTQIEAAPPRTLGDHIEGAVGGKPFRHERAFVYQGETLVLTDNTTATCADLAPASCPAPSPRRVPGRTIEVRGYHHGSSAVLHPASGTLVTMTPTKTGSNATVFITPNGLSVRITREDSGHTTGILHGFISKDRLDVAGLFDATLCPRVCQ